MATYDTLIVNGKIVDGAGTPWCYGDVALQGALGVRAAQWVAMFILVRQARLPKRLDLAGALRTAGSRLNTNIAASWPRDIEAL